MDKVHTTKIDEAEGSRPADNQNPEALDSLEVPKDLKKKEPTKADAKRPADNDNAEPAPATIKEDDESNLVLDVDDKDALQKLQEQNVPTISISEDISSLLEGIDLPVEFKDKAVTIFEASVAGQVADIHKNMLAENEKLVAEYKETIEKQMNEKVDLYLTESVEKWVDENEVAVKSNIRTQIAESFMTQLVGLLETHYITVPEDKEDILESSLNKIAKLEESIEEMMASNKAQKSLIESYARKEEMAKLTADLTDSERERIATLAESIKDVELEVYATKLKTIIEGLTKKPNTDKLVTEDVDAVAIQESDDDVETLTESSTKYSYIGALASVMKTM
jgi:hypothetical protein